MTVRIAFNLSIDDEEFDVILNAHGRTREEWEAEWKDLLLEDLEDALPADDWEPFERGDFTFERQD